MTWLLGLHPQPLRGTPGACEIPGCRGSMGAGLRQSGGASPDGESGAWERVHWSQDSQSKRYQILYTVQRETEMQMFTVSV